MEIYIEGNSVLACDGDQLLTDQLRYFSPIVCILAKAKAVASKLKVPAIVPKDFGAKHAYEIQVVYEFVENWFPFIRGTSCHRIKRYGSFCDDGNYRPMHGALRKSRPFKEVVFHF